MDNRAFTLLYQYGTDINGQYSLLPIQRPRMLGDEFASQAQTNLSAAPAEQLPGIQAGLQKIELLRNSLLGGKLDYPIGYGPLEGLLARVLSQEISYEQALVYAASPEVTVDLCRLYVQFLSMDNWQKAQTGNWRRAQMLQKLLITGLRSLPPSAARDYLRRKVTTDWVEIASAYLVQLPDGRVFREVKAAAEDELAAALAEGAAGQGDQSRLYHRLGELHVDPFVAGKNSGNFANLDQVWRNRLADEMGPAYQTRTDEERAQLDMPQLKETLPLASDYYRKSADLQSGGLRGIALRGLADTLEWRSVVGLEPQPDEMSRVCHEALQYLDFAEYAPQRLSILNTLKRLGENAPEGEAERFFGTSTETLIAGYSPSQVMDVILGGVMLFRGQTKACLARLDEIGEFFAQNADENYRVNRLDTYLLVLRNYARGQQLLPTPPIRDIAAAEQTIQARARKENWHPTSLSLALFALSLETVPLDAELDGLRLLGNAYQAAPGFWTGSLVEMIIYLQGKYNGNVAVNFEHAARPDQAILYNFFAADRYLSLHFGAYALEMIRRVHDLLVSSPRLADIPVNTLQGLLQVALPAETQLGEPATDLLQRISRHLIARMSGANASAELVNLTMQVTKALRFNAALKRSFTGPEQAYDIRNDADGQTLLQRIHQAELHAGYPALRPTAVDAVFNQNLLMAAYINRSETHSGDTPDEQLANLQHAFDERLNRLILDEGQGGDSQELFLSLDAIQAGLDERSVLLNFMISASDQYNISVLVFLITREEMRLINVDQGFPNSEVTMTYGDQTLTMGPMGLPLASLRDDIVKDPGPWPIDRDAAQKLEAQLNYLLVGGVQVLEDLRQAGKDHLIIVPHSALHFIPFHLLGRLGNTPKDYHTLAHDWKISYLPSLYLLKKRPAVQPAPKEDLRPFSALGISFSQPNLLGLPALANSVQEVTGIAAVFQVQPVLEAQATWSAALEALENSRYVHISTHGQHNISGASFQCLYFSPQDEHDGRGFAFEILGRDLRGLDMLTLSACETALGRFDVADNLRGLPASFLLAGVKTIVGTLWPVAALPAEYFFTRLYEEIVKGASRLDAFYAAQTDTRKKYPKSKDWGAFYLIGEWT